jgi:hypothetical protein
MKTNTQIPKGDDFFSSEKKETLEEVAEKYAKDFGCKISYDIYYSFIAGAKWQQEQDKNKYSEDDISTAIAMYLENKSFSEIIKQLKNK